MASNMEEAPRQNPQQSLEPDLDAAGPSTKKAKAKRQWKVGTLPDSRTPIRAGTNVKTPNRPKGEKKVVREAVQEVVDIQMETLTEKVKEPQMSINDLKEKMHGLNEDQWAFRKQQLLGTQNSSERARRQIVERRMRSWLAIRCYSIAESFLPYMVYSKCRNRSRWLLYVPRDQAWRIIPNVSRHTPAVMDENSVGQMDTNGTKTTTPRQRPVCTSTNHRWYCGTVQGGPLKICMKATDLAVDNGTLQLDMSKLKPWWRHIIVYDEFYTYSWAHFSVKDVLATATANAMRKSLFHFFKQPQQGGKQRQAVKLKYNQPLILLELPR